VENDIKSKIETIRPKRNLVIIELIIGLIGLVSMFFYLQTSKEGNTGLLIVGVIGLSRLVGFSCKLNFRNRLKRLKESID